MQKRAGLELLTTSEAAEYLRIRERKLYELIAERQIPCTKVTGKWLLPRADLDRWLLAGMARPYGVVPTEPPPIVGGSHDPLLQWALSETRAGKAHCKSGSRSEEHTSELQSLRHLVCRLLLEKKKKIHSDTL